MNAGLLLIIIFLPFSLTEPPFQTLNSVAYLSGVLAAQGKDGGAATVFKDGFSTEYLMNEVAILHPEARKHFQQRQYVTHTAVCYLLYLRPFFFRRSPPFRSTLHPC